MAGSPCLWVHFLLASPEIPFTPLMKTLSPTVLFLTASHSPPSSKLPTLAHFSFEVLTQKGEGLGIGRVGK